MEPEVRIDTSATFHVALAVRAAVSAEDPWLFHRQGYDWNWRSWSQVAEQVARGAEVLGRSHAPARIAFADRLDPDAIAVALAIQAAGAVAVPVVERRGAGTAGEAWARVAAAHGAGDGADLVLPRVPSRLDRWTPELESLRRVGHGDAVAYTYGGEGRTYRKLWSDTEDWNVRLAVAVGRAPKRWIVLSGAAIERRFHPILLGWTLLTGAAWVLEHDEDAFVTAVLRNRPNLVVAPGTDAGLLALALREKRHRRWHRLEAVGVSDESPAEIVQEAEWHTLGVPVVRFPGRAPR